MSSSADAEAIATNAYTPDLNSIDAGVQQFSKEFSALTKAEIKKHGGPYQYLHANMPTPAERNSFAQVLFKWLPEQDDTIYHHKLVIPAVDEEKRSEVGCICFHIAALGYCESCTTKPPPFEDVADELVDEIFKDGFVTSGDPLLVQQPPELKPTAENPNGIGFEKLWDGDQNGTLPPHSLGYVKGMARSCTILTILHLAHSHSHDLGNLHPKLYTSCLRVWAVHSPESSKRCIALKNAKLSARGSIRKPPNVITILFMGKRLADCGDTDFPAFLKAFNQQSSRAHQVVGKKAMALKLLLNAPSEVMFWDMPQIRFHNNSDIGLVMYNACFQMCDGRILNLRP